MSLDTNFGCPCGSGKKVRFCCGKTVQADLEKIVRAYEGNQRVAALNLIRSARKKHPRNPALLALQAEMEFGQGMVGEAAETLTVLEECSPQNQIAMALRCMIATASQDLDSAIEKLQDVVEVAFEDGLHPLVYEAVGIVAENAYLHDKPEVALAHFRMQATFQRGSDEADPKPFRAIRSLVDSQELALQLRAVPILKGAPEESHEDFFQETAKRAVLGLWRNAADRFRQMLEEGADERSVLSDLATMQIQLGRRQDACSTLRRLANLPNLDEQEAVEAEAVAQLLDKEKEPTVPLVEVEVAISNVDAALERMLADPRFVQGKLPSRDELPEDEPPPKAIFGLTDRNPPEESDIISWRDLPSVESNATLYGRQTDREARVVFSTYLDESFEGQKQYLLDCLGDAAGEVSQRVEEESGVYAADRKLGWEWVFPRWLERDRREALAQEKRKAIMQEQWPRMTFGFLDNQRPIDVAQDPKYRIPLLAALLNVELSCLEMGWEFDVNPLRQELGFPPREPSLQVDDVNEFPLERLLWLDVSTASDEQLTNLVQRAVSAAFTVGLERLLPTLEQRKESLVDQLRFDLIYAELAQRSRNPEQALRYVNLARDEAVARGDSPARMMLASLPFLMMTGRGQELATTIQTLSAHHLEEPGVAESLQQLMMQIQAAQQQAGRPPAPHMAAGGVSAESPAAAPSGLWTPDKAAGEESGGAKKIWIPGMD